MSGFQASEYGPNSDLRLPVCLWMGRAGVRLFDLEVRAEAVEELVVKLLGIVAHDGMWNSETAYQIPPYEVFHLVVCDSS